jgi:hypothetical protein
VTTPKATVLGVDKFPTCSGRIELILIEISFEDAKAYTLLLDAKILELFLNPKISLLTHSTLVAAFIHVMGKILGSWV